MEEAAARGRRSKEFALVDGAQPLAGFVCEEAASPGPFSPALADAHVAELTVPGWWNRVWATRRFARRRRLNVREVCPHGDEGAYVEARNAHPGDRPHAESLEFCLKCPREQESGAFCEVDRSDVGGRREAGETLVAPRECVGLLVPIGDCLGREVVDVRREWAVRTVEQRGECECLG